MDESNSSVKVPIVTDLDEISFRCFTLPKKSFGGFSKLENGFCFGMVNLTNEEKMNQYANYAVIDEAKRTFRQDNSEDTIPGEAKYVAFRDLSNYKKVWYLFCTFCINQNTTKYTFVDYITNFALIGLVMGFAFLAFSQFCWSFGVFP